MDELEKKIESKTRNYILIFILGVSLHMLFAGEGHVINYFYQNGISISTIFSLNYIGALYYTFAYSFAGILFSIILIGPFVYFFHKKYKKKLFASINYAILLGVVFRIFSYYMYWYLGKL